MLSLATCLEQIAAWKSSITAAVSSKQNKEWTLLGSGTGSVSYSASSYSELWIFTYYGGVMSTALIPTVILSKSRIVNVGYYGNPIYVTMTLSTAKVTNQPSNYTATLYIYGR